MPQDLDGHGQRTRGGIATDECNIVRASES
jgi:hypothetical protein